MKKFVIIAASSLLALHASAQFTFEVQSGLWHSKNKELKEYQTGKAATFPAGTRITDAFPAYWFYGANFKWNLRNMQLGASISFGTTGGQVYYRDFSGFQRETQRFSFTSASIVLAKRWAVNDKLSFTLDPRPGVSFGTLKVNSSLWVGNDGSEEENLYTATNFSVEPTASASYRLGRIGLTAFAGYHLDINNDEFSSTRRGWLRPSNGSSNTIHMNLSGYRFGAAAGIYIDQDADEANYPRLYFGPGLGLDYGGIGVNTTVMLMRYFGVHAGVGYNINGVGANGGGRIYFTRPFTHLRPYFSGMYGYNAVINVKNAKQFNRTFYGASFGVGLDIEGNNDNYWTLAVYIPVRKDAVDDYIDYLKRYQGATFKTPLLPFTVSFGYRFAFAK